MGSVTQEEPECHLESSLLLFLQRSGTRGKKEKISAPRALLLENPELSGAGRGQKQQRRIVGALL